MILKVGVEISDGCFEITTLIEDVFGYFDKGAFLVCDYRGTSGHVIYERYFTKRVSRIVVDLFRLFPFVLVDHLYAVGPFQDYVEILSLVSFFEDDLIFLMELEF